VAGSYTGPDRFGLDILLPNDQRMMTVAKLAVDGYPDPMAPSHDASCEMDWLPRDIREQEVPNPALHVRP
jgi:phosphotriesterase-related protein